MMASGEGNIISCCAPLVENLYAAGIIGSPSPVRIPLISLELTAYLFYHVSGSAATAFMVSPPEQETIMEPRNASQHLGIHQVTS